MSGQEPEAVAARYETLIERGVYAGRFSHAPSERSFVAEVLRTILVERSRRPGPISVLDCGCGPGEWLDDVGRLAAEVGLPAIVRMGFDLTPGMVTIARDRLADGHGPVELWTGDILDPASFRPDDGPGFDLVFAFDVIQQLPRSAQSAALGNMLGAVVPGGTVVVFDHDRDTAYGRRMGLKKWLTRYLRIPLVPRYYVESAYPRLGRLAATFRGDPGLAVRIEARPSTTKLALVMRRRETGPTETR